MFVGFAYMFHVRDGSRGRGLVARGSWQVLGGECKGEFIPFPPVSVLSGLNEQPHQGSQYTGVHYHQKTRPPLQELDFGLD